jgi:hypothetical protein
MAKREMEPSNLYLIRNEVTTETKRVQVALDNYRRTASRIGVIFHYDLAIYLPRFLTLRV